MIRDEYDNPNEELQKKTNLTDSNLTKITIPTED